MSCCRIALRSEKAWYTELLGDVAGTNLMEKYSDEKIIDSWHKNASPWITAIQERQIESRKRVTDSAITDVLVSLAGHSVLDLGCGEGWLCRKLASLGLVTLGIDAVPELLASAKQASATLSSAKPSSVVQGGKVEFRHIDYQSLSAKVVEEKFDIAVSNFSLLGKESVERLFNVVPDMLKDGGYFVVQTLHPVISCGKDPYKDGWRGGSWDGFSREFVDPAPWYFRTLESWCDLFYQHQLQLVSIKEPIYPNTGSIASLILVGKVHR